MERKAILADVVAPSAVIMPTVYFEKRGKDRARQEEKLKKLHEKGVLDDQKLNEALEGLQKAQVVTEIFSEQSRRSNVITVRLTDESMRCLDDLISAII